MKKLILLSLLLVCLLQSTVFAAEYTIQAKESQAFKGQFYYVILRDNKEIGKANEFNLPGGLISVTTTTPVIYYAYKNGIIKSADNRYPMEEKVADKEEALARALSHWLVCWKTEKGIED